MSKQSLIEIDGAVHAESHGIYTVTLVNGHEARAALSGRIRSNHVNVVLGDAVRVALSPYDLTHGRIVYRYPTRHTRAA